MTKKAKNPALTPETIPTTASFETHDGLTRVGEAYEALTAAQVKAEYDKLDGTLEALSHDVVHSTQAVMEHLLKMQSLLSQRGSDRERVVREAGCPGWSEYLNRFAEKLSLSTRTIHRKLQALRSPDGLAVASTPANGASRKVSRMPHGRSVIEAQVADEDSSTIVGRGEDQSVHIQAHQDGDPVRAIAATPQVAHSQEHDWEQLLRELLAFLNEYEDLLPTQVKTKVLVIDRTLKQSATW